ncbi:MAG TPA: class I SAM-dependent methyltransferase, partial [Thermoleophilia bacterium]
GLASLAPVYGFDIDPRAIDAARANVRRAGLVGKILVERRDLSSLTPPDAPRPAVGLVVVNPPYGKRLGEQQELVGLYEELGETLKRSFSGWTAAILTGNPELGAHLGLRARRTNVFYNGSILCKLLTFDVDPVQYGTQGALRAAETVGRSAHVAQAEIPAYIPAPVPAAELREPAPTFALDFDAAAPVAAALGSGGEMFANRLRKNLKHLRSWAAREDVHCFRVYDADLPEYAVAVDIYEDWAHVQEYAPPRTVDPVHARRRIKEVMVAVPEVLGIPSARVVLKVRRQQRGAEQYQKVDERGKYVEAREGGLRFLVNLTDYLDTGLFLDHRLTRALIRELAPGRRFLNLFAYTGTATVYAAAGEAASTTTVDLSANYLEWARRNLELNNLDGPQHHLVQADCLVWLRETAAKIRRAAPRGANVPVTSTSATRLTSAPLRATTARGGRAPMGTAPADLYDLILLDAPTFSNSKRMEGTLDLQRDHADLIEATAALLSPEGILLFSTNFRRFKLDPALLEVFRVDDISKKTLPPDFERNPRIHSCFRIMRRGAAPPAPPVARQTGWRKEPHAL